MVVVYCFVVFFDVWYDRLLVSQLVFGFFFFFWKLVLLKQLVLQLSFMSNILYVSKTIASMDFSCSY